MGTCTTNGLYSLYPVIAVELTIEGPVRLLEYLNALEAFLDVAFLIYLVFYWFNRLLASCFTYGIAL